MKSKKLSKKIKMMKPDPVYVPIFFLDDDGLTNRLCKTYNATKCDKINVFLHTDFKFFQCHSQLLCFGRGRCMKVEGGHGRGRRDKTEHRAFPGRCGRADSEILKVWVLPILRSLKSTSRLARARVLMVSMSKLVDDEFFTFNSRTL